MKCVICGHSDLMVCKARFRPFLIARMFAEKAQDTDVCVCKKCGFEYASYRPNDAQMQRQYDGYMLEEYLQQRESFEKGFIEQTLCVVNDENLANRRANLAQFIAPFIADSKPQTILDYGGGGGARLFLWSCIMLSALSLIFPIKSLCQMSLKSKTKMSFAQKALISSSAPIC